MGLQRGRRLRDKRSRPQDARNRRHHAHRRRRKGIPLRIKAARGAREVLRLHAGRDLSHKLLPRLRGIEARDRRRRKASAPEGLLLQASGQRHPSALAQKSVRLHRRGVQGVLREGLPRLPRAALLDPYKRRLSAQFQGHPLLSEAQHRDGQPRGSDQALL